MLLNIRLNDMRTPRIAGIQVIEATRILQQIVSRNLAKATNGAESKQFTNRKEAMKQRLMKRGASDSFESVTSEFGRERLLLSLYLDYTSRTDASWLPPFDATVAASVLGNDISRWHPGRLRQATQLFFTHFTRLPEAGLNLLCSLLLQAYGEMPSPALGPAQAWWRERLNLFSAEGVERVATSAPRDLPLNSLFDRFGVPRDGYFAERLRHVFLLKSLREAPLGKEVPSLSDIESLRNERASGSLLIGAAALQIMVRRIAQEGMRKWSGDWPRWLTRLGCDPRHGRATAEGAKWWGWATDDELRLAQQGITGLTLRFFVDFLEKSLERTDKESKFSLRSRFLLALHEAGKIQSARVVLNMATYRGLPTRDRDVWSVAQLGATTEATSMVCLKCVDDIYIIEGTHTFGLRVFHRIFPVSGFWGKPQETYLDSALRISPDKCSVFLQHDQHGRWVDRFFSDLRSSFHVEWSDVHL
jgi:hypothetical protein